MRLLTNPIMIRALTVFICSAFFLLLGIFFVRSLRKNIEEESEIPEGPTGPPETLPLNLYNTVIQQLKQQKHELQVQSQSDQHRARVTENFSQAVLSNLSCGVLVFGANGLVKSSNPAAKAILGFASMNGMSAEDIFRASMVRTAEGNLNEPIRIADEVQAVLREGVARRQVDAKYQTPSGEQRFLAMTISQVPAADGSLLGVACLVNDRSELEGIRQQQQLHGELSAEMALQLRTSITTIAGYAQQLASNHDPEMAKQLAMDIAHEAAQLDRSMGGFLTGSSASGGKSAGAAAGR